MQEKNEKVKRKLFMFLLMNTEVLNSLLESKGTTALSSLKNQNGRKESVISLLDATSVSGFIKPQSATPGLQSLIHVPDFRQQWGKLLVLEAKGKNLLRVDAA